MIHPPLELRLAFPGACYGQFLIVDDLQGLLPKEGESSVVFFKKKPAFFSFILFARFRVKTRTLISLCRFQFRQMASTTQSRQKTATSDTAAIATIADDDDDDDDDDVDDDSITYFPAKNSKFSI